ncbi:WAT1-related protein At3g02690, chloroplastic [Typha angustifolia]|uniref:WAT1-related protein At3g02690, chloroplastic n=1 Tax=Typha angustifolia TaxID=59011 RepID=UPI003C2D280F
MSTAVSPSVPIAILFPPPKSRTVMVPRVLKRSRTLIRCRSTEKMSSSRPPTSPMDCIGTGADVECFVTEASSESDQLLAEKTTSTFEIEVGGDLKDSGTGEGDLVRKAVDWAILVSPFFFWGTAMVAMKEVIPKTGPFFVSAVRLIPAGALLIGFAAIKGRKQPSGLLAWVSILAFAVIDAACFQGFLAEGLQKTSAGLGSVIIDSQPLTVAILAALLFGESIGGSGAAGLVLGVVGLLLLEVPAISFEENNSTIWGSGEWWMLLAAQSMAIGTIMVRWVSKYSDPVMATGWHMAIGGLPLLVISVLNHEPALNGNLRELSSSDVLALCYTSVFGSAVSYGVFFYNATRGSLTKLSSLTFLTPMFASIFGFLYLGETFSPIQLGGALLTLIAIYMVNYRSIVDKA